MSAFAHGSRAACLLAVLAMCGLGGCADTLVFGERTGFNLSVHVNDSAATPLSVNAGLERTVASVVPPAAVDGDQAAGQKAVAVGEAVSMFSGFRLEYLDGEQPEQGALGRDLRIRTQFASGGAALDLAGNPAAVARITDVSFRRDGGFATAPAQDRVRALLAAIDALSDERAFALNRKPPATSGSVEASVAAADPDNRRFTDADVARAMHKMRVSLIDRDDATLAAWEAALAPR